MHCYLILYIQIYARNEYISYIIWIQVETYGCHRGYLSYMHQVIYTGFI